MYFIPVIKLNDQQPLFQSSVSEKEQHLLEIKIFCIIFFTVSFEQFEVPLCPEKFSLSL